MQISIERTIQGLPQSAVTARTEFADKSRASQEYKTSIFQFDFSDGCLIYFLLTQILKQGGGENYLIFQSRISLSNYQVESIHVQSWKCSTIFLKLFWYCCTLIWINLLQRRSNAILADGDRSQITITLSTKVVQEEKYRGRRGKATLYKYRTNPPEHVTYPGNKTFAQKQ